MVQIYEQYWSYTAAFTDLFGNKAITTLKICVEFLDEYKNKFYTKELYDKLQNTIKSITGIDLISIRKAVNQFVKLGFLKPLLAGYQPETIEFLTAPTSFKKKSILSKIVYKYANFDNSMTKPNFSSNRQINFVLKTLEEIGHISERELVALMIVDISQHQKGYLDAVELSHYYQVANEDGFIARKYNQVSHLKNLLGKLDDLTSLDGNIYFETEAKRIFGNNLHTKQLIKEPYLQRVYNCELVDESKSILGQNTSHGMLEGDESKIYVPSHIKPIQHSSENEMFDVNNGLLLSPNTDQFLTDGLISFNDDGTIISSSILGEEIHQMLSHMRLNPQFLNEERIDYIQYHRNQVFGK